MKVVVFEHEEQSSLTVRSFLSQNHYAVEVLAFDDSFDNAMSLIEYHKPDFIFADAMLHGHSIYEMMQEVKDQNTYDFIIMTPHSEFVLQALPHEVMDYILKPLVKEQLNLALCKMKRKHLQNHIASKPNTTSDVYPFLGISSIDKIEVIAKQDIMYAEADGRYTHFNLADHTIKTASKNLGEIEKYLIESDFLRVHHSFIVNMNYVKSISKTDGFLIEFKTTTKTIPVSKRKQNALMRFLQIKY